MNTESGRLAKCARARRLVASIPQALRRAYTFCHFVTCPIPTVRLSNERWRAPIDDDDHDDAFSNWIMPKVYTNMNMCVCAFVATSEPAYCDVH